MVPLGWEDTMRCSGIAGMALLATFATVPGAVHGGVIAPSTTWGTLGSGPGQFQYPVGLSVDPSGSVYVVDQGNHRIQKFTNDGVFITQWGTRGSDDGQFDQPQDICIGQNGSIYVVEDQNHRVQRFSSDGAFEVKWGHFDSCDGNFQNPTGIGTDAQGNVYVADGGNERIQKFDPNGAFILKWGSWPDPCNPGEWLGETLGAVDVAGSGLGVVVTDRYANRLVTYSSEGTAGTSWGCSGSGSYARGIAIDAQNRVYVADFIRDVIQVFSETGSPIIEFGATGNGPGAFDLPASVAVDTDGNVFVADMRNHRIQKFSPSGITSSRRISWGSLRLKYR